MATRVQKRNIQLKEEKMGEGMRKWLYSKRKHINVHVHVHVHVIHVGSGDQ